MHAPSLGRLRLPAVALILVGSMSACTSSGATPAAPTPTPWPSVVALPAILPDEMTYAQMLPLFSYNGGQPLNVTVASTQVATSKDHATATVKDITYIGAAGDTIEAYLILPEGSGPFPAVLFEHWSIGSREDFLPEAIILAQRHHIAGIVPTRPTLTDGEDRSEMVLQVREMRRALDLLEAQPEVDRTRLGFVGHSLGAIYGTSLLAVDTRIKTAALMAVLPYDLYDDITAPHVTVPSILLQFGTQDDLYTKETAESFAALIPAKKKVTWYDYEHSLGPDATAERETWLTQKLGAK